jgi:predicted ATPase
MLTSLRIQNFRSIRDASVKLGQVNLFIGPNNSGKSNFLKGIEFASKNLNSQVSYTEAEFDQIITRGISTHIDEARYFGDNIPYIELTAQFNFKYPEIIPQNSLFFKRDGFKGSHHTHITINRISYIWEDLSEAEKQNLDLTPSLLKELIKDVIVYRPDPMRIILPNNLSVAENLGSDGYNLTNFLFNLSQNYKGIFEQLEKDFTQCVGSFTQVSTPADPSNKGFLKLKFFDSKSNSYWAEEVSEGVLYFLALLCIVHQPDPPKLLLLEEPEKGIHPRRIKEVMDFIFELAQLRDIQIILTSHSPYVVDHFADIPECISVFDRENGETVIRNAGDIITETNAKLEAEGKKPIRYTDALGEHWVSGFLGGVPV